MDKPKRIWKAMPNLLIAVLKALVCTLSSAPGAWAQIQGSVFVDCGSMASYVDGITNISWVPDAPEYITTGVNGYVPSAPSIYPNFSEFTTVRYFPDTRAKNCYSFSVMPNSTYLIRGTFLYGNYDNGTTLPSFQMAIDGTIVANVTFDNAAIFVYHEFTVALNFGGDGLVRHPDDEFDRYWFPIQGSNSTFIQSSSPLQSLVSTKIVGNEGSTGGDPPATVMDTALTSSGNITISFPDYYNYEYILSFYYAEFNSTANASSRIFYLEVQDQTVSSPLDPIANALETWEMSTNPMATMTNNQDGIAIEEIKSNMNSVLSITAVALDYNDLNGSLPLLTRLANLQYLFLQNNLLFGIIPNWLVDLPHLSELFVWNNNFSSPIPPSLLSKNSNWNFT
ncbi:unnamed protein product [Sphagnum balticum]